MTFLTNVGVNIGYFLFAKLISLPVRFFSIPRILGTFIGTQILYQDFDVTKRILAKKFYVNINELLDLDEEFLFEEPRFRKKIGKIHRKFQDIVNPNFDLSEYEERQPSRQKPTTTSILIGGKKVKPTVEFEVKDVFDHYKRTFHSPGIQTLAFQKMVEKYDLQFQEARDRNFKILEEIQEQQSMQETIDNLIDFFQHKLQQNDSPNFGNLRFS
jgi:hypothetical protein